MRYATAAQSSNQIGDVAVNVNAGGTLDFNGATDVIGNTLTVGGGTVTNTGAGGSLQVTTLTMSGGLADSAQASSTSMVRSITTAACAAPLPPRSMVSLTCWVARGPSRSREGYPVENDLTINARTFNGRLAKAGTGALLMTNANNSLLAGIDEKQTVTIAGPATAATRFTVTFNGTTTANIEYSIDPAVTAASIQTALRSLANVGATGVTVSDVSALVFEVTFTGHLGSVDQPNVLSGALSTAGGATGITALKLGRRCSAASECRHSLDSQQRFARRKPLAH